jgi:amino acid transporter
MTKDPARSRWLALVLVRIVAASVAVLGVMLLANGVEPGRKLLGGAIVVVALWTMAIVPRALARRWRSPIE